VARTREFCFGKSISCFDPEDIKIEVFGNARPISSDLFSIPLEITKGCEELQ
jgi:hypothetical protein